MKQALMLVLCLCVAGVCLAEDEISVSYSNISLPATLPSESMASIIVRVAVTPPVSVSVAGGVLQSESAIGDYAITRWQIYPTTTLTLDTPEPVIAERLTLTFERRNPADVTMDGAINQADLLCVRRHLGERNDGLSLDYPWDVNQDGIVNVLDLVLVRNAIQP